MTSKHYNNVAASLAATLREHPPHSKEYNAVMDAAHNLAADFRAADTRFNSDEFLEFLRDVLYGRRDLNGKRVAA